jgi:hypothetical protein
MLGRLTERWSYLAKLRENLSFDEDNADSQEVLDDVIIRVAAREYLDTLKVGHSKPGGRGWCHHPCGGSGVPGHPQGSRSFNSQEVLDDVIIHVAAREYLDTLKVVGHSTARRSWMTSSFVWRLGSTWTPSR